MYIRMKHILLRNGEGFYIVCMIILTFNHRGFSFREDLLKLGELQSITTEDTSDGLDCNSYSTPTSRANTPDWNGKSCKSCATTLQIKFVICSCSLYITCRQFCEDLKRERTRTIIYTRRLKNCADVYLFL